MPLTSLNLIAEQRLRAAEARGELRNLPGQGKKLAEDDSAHLPAELRMAYKILKNHGLLPVEAQLLKDIGVLRDKIKTSDEQDPKQALLRKELESLCLDFNSRAQRHAKLEQSSLKNKS